MSKEILFRKPSAKFKSMKEFLNLHAEQAMKKSETQTQNDQIQIQDLSQIELEQTEKLDTITESAVETLQQNTNKQKACINLTVKNTQNTKPPPSANGIKGILVKKLNEKSTCKPAVAPRSILVKSRSHSSDKPNQKYSFELELNKARNFKTPIGLKCDPVRIESSRIEKNKKPSITNSKEHLVDVFAESFQSNLTNTTSKSTLCPSTDIKLEVNSSRINLYERASSAKSVVSTNSQNTCKIVQSNEPIIYNMFEDYPQPFSVPRTETSNSKTSVGSANSKKKLKPKSTNSILNQRKAVTSGNKLTKQTNSAGIKPKQTKINLKKNSKIVINLSQQNLEENLQKEIEKSISLEQDLNLNDQLVENELSSSCSNSILNLSENEQNISIKETNNNMNQTESSRINKDFVKSFEDKVFAIYSKFDHLLMLQENKLEGKESDDQKKELNEQKAQFSEEIAKELQENINFDEISSNPELIQRLKELYDIVKKNTNQEVKQNEIVVNKPPLPSQESSQKSPKQNPAEIGIRRNSMSIKSNADIREVYSIVNSMSKTNSAELTIIPGRLTKTYKIPANLTDKINTLMVTLPNPNTNNNNINNDAKNKLAKSFDDAFDQTDEQNNFKANSKLKFNYVIF